MRDDSPTVIFVDQVSFFSLLQACRYSNRRQTILYFDTDTLFAKQWLRVFCWLHLVSSDVRKVDHHIGQVRNDVGDHQENAVRGYTRAICVEIKRDQLQNNRLIKEVGSVWATGKVSLYFEKMIEGEIHMECSRISLTEWIVRTQFHLPTKQCILLVSRKRWFLYLAVHARSQGIRLSGYWAPGNRRQAGKSRHRLFRSLKLGVIAVSKFAWRCAKRFRSAIVLSDLSEKTVSKKPVPTSTVAIQYWHQGLSLDPTKRSEFFWVEESGICYSEILLYNFVTDKAVDSETLDQLRTRGIKLLGRGPEIPAWSPTLRIFRVYIHTVFVIIKGVFRCLIHERSVSLYTFYSLLSLAESYSYWHDFFVTNRVRVNVGTLHTSLGQILALDAIEGVSMGYQHSIGFLTYSHPTAFITAGENVWFVYSSVFEQIWRGIGSSIDNFVHTGYVFDRALHKFRELNRVDETRKQLQDNGAEFILCYFDENSVNKWNIGYSHRDVSDDYAYLLNWLLADPTIGIVFKPKQFKDLFERIASISDLIRKAKQTGRCQFLVSDAVYGSIYPAEAACTADMCIGHLSGGSASFEANLVGVPALLIDIPKNPEHPLHARGDDRVVFKDWHSLRVAIDQYRVAPEACSGLGDWSTLRHKLDPFQDGKASLRLSLYVGWIYEALKQGMPRSAALEGAAEKFAEQWGEGHVTLGN